jgi:integrase
MALTALEIKNAKTGYHADGNGLYLQVSKSNSKSWIFRYSLNKKRREMGLGSLSKVTSVDARHKANELSKKVSLGIDPIEEKDSSKASQDAVLKTKQITFMVVAREYIQTHSPSWRNAKHAQQWENTLTTYIEPVFKNTPIDEVDVDLVLKALSPIWSTKSETASRIRGRIEKVLSYAKGKKYRAGENPAVWRGNLDALLPANSKVKRTKHHPSLPFKHIASFMADLRARTGISSRALEFTILTASRSGAVRQATWSEFDLENKIWDVPASHMKGQRDHRVPLSDTVISLLKALPQLESSNLVFPSPRKQDSALSDDTLKMVIELINKERIKKALPIWVDPVYDKEIVPHGFRSTFRDWAAETTSYPHELQEIALAHTQSDKTEAAYRRGDMLEKRAQLMQDWANHCEVSNSNVISIKVAKSK